MAKVKHKFYGQDYNLNQNQKEIDYSFFCDYWVPLTIFKLDFYTII